MVITFMDTDGPWRPGDAWQMVHPPKREEPPAGINYFRRGIGIVCGVAPAGLLIASALHALAHLDEPFWRAGTLAIIAGAIAALNFFLSFVSPLLYSISKTHHNRHRRVSGVPLVGTLFVIAAGAFGFGAAGTSVLALFALGLDTGGIPWFVATTWHDQSFWDA